MTEGAQRRWCRVTVVAPRTRMDLALPAAAPLAELLPALLGYAGEDAADAAGTGTDPSTGTDTGTGTPRAGWLLQRLGQPALDPAEPLATLGVRDGEVLYLLPAADAVPPAVFDDVADAVGYARGTGGRLAEPRDTRPAALAGATVLLTLGLGAALAAGPPWTAPATVLLAGCAALLAGSAICSRRRVTPGLGAGLGAAAVGYAAAGGFLLAGPGPLLGPATAERLLTGCGAALLAALLALPGTRAGRAGLGAVAAGAAICGLGVAGHLVVGGPAGNAAAVLVVGLLAASPVLPGLAQRIGRLPAPELPADAADLRHRFAAPPAADILARARAAHRALTVAVGTWAVVIVAAAAFLAVDPRWYGPGLAALAGLALALRSRRLPGLLARAVALGAGTTAALAGAGALAAQPPVPRVVLAAAAVAGGLILLVVAAVLPGWRPSPYWGRAADLAETGVLLAVVPLAAGCLGLYDVAAGLG